MYPEKVYTLSLPLPYELLRPIAFQVAYMLIKEKLQFPKYDQGSFLGAFLCIVENEEKSVFFHWYEGVPGVFTIQLIHRIYHGDHERKYYSILSDNGYSSHVMLSMSTEMMIKFFT